MCLEKKVEDPEIKDHDRAWILVVPKDGGEKFENRIPPKGTVVGRADEEASLYEPYYNWVWNYFMSDPELPARAERIEPVYESYMTDFSEWRKWREEHPDYYKAWKELEYPEKPLKDDSTGYFRVDALAWVPAYDVARMFTEEEFWAFAGVSDIEGVSGKGRADRLKNAWDVYDSISKDDAGVLDMKSAERVLSDFMAFYREVRYSPDALAGDPASDFDPEFFTQDGFPNPYLVSDMVRFYDGPIGLFDKNYKLEDHIVIDSSDETIANATLTAKNRSGSVESVYSVEFTKVGGRWLISGGKIFDLVEPEAGPKEWK